MSKTSKTEAADVEITIFIPDPMAFLVEPHEIRLEAFQELRKHSSFPVELIDAVESYRYKTPVRWVKAADEQAEAIPIIGKDKSQDSSGHHGHLEQPGEEAQEELPRTAAELMAARLRQSFGELKAAQKGRSSSPVRQDRMLARTTIAEIALDILESCRVFEFEPGPELVALFRALLEVDKPKLARTKNYEAQYKAAWVLAQAEIGSNQLARFVGVNKATMSDWLKDKGFQDRVMENKEFIKRQTARGLWPPSPGKGL